MVLQIFADGGQRVGGVNAMLAQQRGIADAGELQQMRRIHRAGRQDDLAAGASGS